jgi:hypothetical protein
MNKIDKPLANLTKMRRGKTQTNKIKNKYGEITTKTNQNSGIIKDYIENLIFKLIGKSRRNEQISRHI